MLENLFADPRSLALGAVTGLVFGVLLQKGGVTRYETIVSQFLFRDFTVLKVMLTAIVVGAVGVWAMLQAGLIEHLHVKSAALLVNALGGIVFGIGMAVLGYCPGTAVGAVGQGSRDAIAGVAGMVAGAALYAEAYPFVNDRLEPVMNLGKATFPAVANASPWWFVAGLALLAVALFAAIERSERRHPAPR